MMVVRARRLTSVARCNNLHVTLRTWRCTSTMFVPHRLVSLGLLLDLVVSREHFRYILCSVRLFFLNRLLKSHMG